MPEARAPRHVLIAPDSFKRCLPSAEVASALADGVRAVWPGAAVRLLPLADGGEGTVEAVAAAMAGELIEARVSGPLGEPVTACWWRSADGGVALVELASASGMERIPAGAPLRTSTRGTGELIRAVAEAGVERILVGAGGSATVDGGAGALAALGFQLLDAAGAPIADGGGGLLALAHVEAPPEAPPSVEVLCDVRNPLLGPTGAARVYGPQKGAGPAEVETLEAGLAHFARHLAAAFGRDPSAVPGAGAAGGFSGGLWAALGARLVPGFDTVADLVGLDGALAEADLVLTGEGRLDAQTAYGKTIAALVERCGPAGIPVWAFAGDVTEAGEAWCAERGVAALPIAVGPAALADSLRDTSALLRRAAARAARFAGAWP